MASHKNSKTGVAFADGKLIPINWVAVPITDLAVQRGTGLFETMRTYHGRPFALSQRLERLEESARFMGLKFSFTKNFIVGKVYEGLKKFGHKEALVKIMVTGGDAHSLAPEGPARLYILFMPFVPWPKSKYEKGVRVMTSMLPRMNPELKSLSYLSGVVADGQARRAGFDEALHVDEKRRILEGTTFNFAIIKNKRLITARKRVLSGITLEIALGQARRLGLKVSRRPIDYKELKTADEAFITSATREVIPVVRVDKIKIGQGRPGVYTKKLLAAYRVYADRVSR